MLYHPAPPYSQDVSAAAKIRDHRVRCDRLQYATVIPPNRLIVSTDAVAAGKYTAEHIARQLPTDLKWAIAGRSESKLRAVADELRAEHPDRVQPGVEISQLNKSELTDLAKKTKVLISTVGPFHKYGEAAFAACAETGTHYLDCTGEV